MANENLSQVINRISAHVNERNHYGSFEKPSSGPPVNVTDEASLKRHISDTINDPSTESFVASDDGKKVYFYNRKTNTVVIIDPDSPFGGSAYRPKTPSQGERWFDKQKEIWSAQNPGKPLESHYGGVSGLEARLSGAHHSFQAPSISSEHREGGRLGRAAAAVSVALVAISAAQQANAASSTQQAVIAAGREVLMGIIPFTGAAEALSQGRRAEAIVSFIGDCSFLGMGASEMLRPLLRAAGSNVEPGMIESALSGVRQPNPVSPQKLAMMDMVRDIPALSPEEISSRRIPYGPVAQVSVQKYQMAQEMEKIKALVNGRNLEDLSPAEQDQYGRLMGRVQMSAREIKRVWEKEVDRQLGPSCNYNGSDPVQKLRNQISENLNRSNRQSKSFSPDDIRPRTRGLSQPFQDAHDQDPPQIDEADLKCDQPQNNQDPELDNNIDSDQGTDPKVGRYDILKERGALSQIFLDMHNKPKDAPNVKSFPAEEVYIKKGPDLGGTLSP